MLSHLHRTISLYQLDRLPEEAPKIQADYFAIRCICSFDHTLLVSEEMCIKNVGLYTHKSRVVYGHWFLFSKRVSVFFSFLFLEFNSALRYIYSVRNASMKLYFCKSVCGERKK